MDQKGWKGLFQQHREGIGDRRCGGIKTNSFSFLVMYERFYLVGSVFLLFLFLLSFLVRLRWFSFPCWSFVLCCKIVWPLTVLHGRISWSKRHRPDVLQPRTKLFCFAFVFAFMVTIATSSWVCFERATWSRLQRLQLRFNIPNIPNNKRNVEWMLKQSLDAFKLLQHRFNIVSTRFDTFQLGWKVVANAFNIPIQQNWKDVEANVEAVSLGLKETRKGFSLHAHAQSTPRCTRQQHACKTSAHAQDLYFQIGGCECELHKNARFWAKIELY